MAGEAFNIIAGDATPPVVLMTLLDQAKASAIEEPVVQESDCSSWSDQSGIFEDIVRPP